MADSVNYVVIAPKYCESCRRLFFKQEDESRHCPECLQRIAGQPKGYVEVAKHVESHIGVGVAVQDFCLREPVEPIHVGPDEYPSVH
jgi:hypothetical protein